MIADFKTSVLSISRKDGYRIFTLSVTYGSNKSDYKIYAFDKDIPFKELYPPQEALKQFAIDEMKSWIKKSSGGIPENKFLVLMNGGKVPTDDIVKTIMSVQEKASDLVRTNVTIAAPLFEWAKAKAQKESTSLAADFQEKSITQTLKRTTVNQNFQF